MTVGRAQWIANETKSPSTNTLLNVYVLSLQNRLYLDVTRVIY